MIAILSGGAVALSGAEPFAAAMLSLLSVLALTDLMRRILPNELTYLLIGIGLVASYPALVVSAIGMVAGFAALWSIRAFWLRYREIEAIGIGDVKLLAGIGAFSGPLALPEIVFWGAIFGIVFGLAGRALHWFEGDDIPFGAALAASVWLYVSAGPVLFPVA